MSEAVQRELAEVKEEIKQVKSTIKQLEQLPKEDPERQQLAGLQQQLAGLQLQLAELLKEKNRLAEGVAGAAGAAVSDLADLQDFAERVGQLVAADEPQRFMVWQIPPGNTIPASLRSNLYIRQCYRTALKLILAFQHGEAVVITGTPGIGKSAFALYLIAHLACLKQKVVYSYLSPPSDLMFLVFDFSKGTKPEVAMASTMEGNMNLIATHRKDADAWHIMDGAAGKAQWDGRGRAIVLSSPNKDNYSSFIKGPKVLLRYFPIWAHSAIERCRGRLYMHISREEALERYACFGGVIRYVLVNTHVSCEAFKAEIDKNAAMIAKDFDLLSTRSDFRHHLVHFVVEPDLVTPRLVLASPEVADLVAEVWFRVHVRDVSRRLVSGVLDPDMRAFIGVLFERHSHRLCCRGGMLITPRELERPEQLGDKRSAEVHLQGTERTQAAAISATTVGLAAMEDVCMGDATSAIAECEDEEYEQPNHLHNEAATAVAVQLSPQPTTVAQAGPSGQVAVQRAAEDLALRLRLEKTQLNGVAHRWYCGGMDWQELPANTYVQPPTSNNPAWDACFVAEDCIYILQYTVSIKHGIKAAPLCKLLDQLGCDVIGDRVQTRHAGKEVRLLFLVPGAPSDAYYNFKWQPYLNADGGRRATLPSLVRHLKQYVASVSLDAGGMAEHNTTATAGSSGARSSEDGEVVNGTGSLQVQ